MSTSPCRSHHTTGGPLACAHAPGEVYRVGFPPDPWAWSGWEYARNDGRFGGRWDDANGEFRTVYAGTTLLGCLLEVLAPLRPDPRLAAELDDIAEDAEDAREHPTVAAGRLSRSWLTRRQASRAHLSGDDQRSLDGVRFWSRHGDEHELWAVFEHDDDGTVSRCITDTHAIELDDHPDLTQAMAIHGLRWG